MDVNIVWDAPIVATGVTGYRVYYGTTPGVYDFGFDAGLSLSATITLPTVVENWYFTAVSYDADDIESVFANEIVWIPDPYVSLVVAPASVDEDELADIVFTFTRSSTVGALTVDFTIGGTAAFTTDYTQAGAATFAPPDGTITFADGEADGVVTITPVVDSVAETNETVTLTLEVGAGYNVLTPGAVVATIFNEDTDVTVAVAPSEVDEDGATNLVFTFTRSPLTTGAITVNFSVGGTATFATDYAQAGAASFGASSGTVIIVDGNATAAVTLNPASDIIVELDETVILTVLAGSGYSVGTPSAATGTIANDDTVAPGVFTAVPYAKSRHGLISPATRQTGATIEFTATPRTDHVIKEWQQNRVVVQTGGDTYTATGAEGEIAVVKAVFEDAP